MSSHNVSRWINCLVHRPNARQPGVRQQGRSGNALHRTLRFEPLEDRMLLSLAAGVIVTAAGTGYVHDNEGGYSGDGGQATAAEINQPCGTCVDSAGDLFIADTNNNRIREVNYATGVITTIAGNGSSGHNGDGGQATAAELNSPRDVAINSVGELFIADEGNNRIREVNLSTGVITTVAGNGDAGYNNDGIQATAAKLDGPMGVAVDSVGNLYIADTLNECIRKVDMSTGVITDVAGIAGSEWGSYSGDGGQATKAGLNTPFGVAVDSVGDLFIADTDNMRIREVNHANQVITTVAGDGYTNISGNGGYSGDGGQATKAELNGPRGVAVDAAGDIFIGDTDNDRVREVNHANQIISTVAGNGTPGYSGDNGPAAAAMLCAPEGLALNLAGDLFIVDNSNERIREVGALTQQSTTLVLNSGSYVSAYGGTLTFSATLSCGGADVNAESVSFTIDGSTAGSAVTNSSGVATFNTAQLTLSIGSHSVGAAFNGDLGYNGSTDTATLALNQATPAVTVTDAGGIYNGERFPATALVAGVVSGTDDNPASSLQGVTPTLAYYTGSTPSGSATSLAPSVIGTYTVVANFAGSTDYAAASSSPQTFTIGPPSYVPIETINTVAGGGTGGLGDNGPATDAQLAFPSAVVLDSAGDIFIADTDDCLIREVNETTGYITTVAGNGEMGHGGDGGQATDAELSLPQGVAVDSAGDIFIADTGNNCIREILPNGVITRVAGTGIPGSSGDGGQATDAELWEPSGVAVDSAGNIFIADTMNGEIREVNHSSGVITTVAGGGTGGLGDGGQATNAEILAPQGVAVDSAGNIFIADTQDNLIRKVSASTGIITTVAGNGTAGYSGDGGPATAAEINNPTGVTLDSSGDIFIADYENNCIREVDFSTGVITTVAGNSTSGFSGDGGPATAAQLANPSGMAVDSAGDIFIADSDNSVIREVSATPPPATTLVLGGDSGVGTYGGTLTIAATLSSDGVAVAGESVLFALNGSRVGTAITDSNGVATLPGVNLTGLSVGSYSEYVNVTFAGDASYGWSDGSGTLVVNPATPTVTVADLSGSYNASPFAATALAAGVVAGVDSTPAPSLEGVTPTLTYYAGPDTSGSSSSVAPSAIGTYTVVASFAGSADYTAASSSPLVFSISAGNPGQINTVAGNGNPGFSGDGGPATDATVQQPYGVVVDSVGDLFIADIGGSRVREVNHATGLITTVAGNGMAGYSGDGGQATAAELDNPAGLAVNSVGDLFIADSTNNRIREVNLTTGVITTVAGTGIDGYSGDGGQATAAQLGQPYGVAVDSAGNLFIADDANNRIREVNVSSGVITTVAGNGVSGYGGDGGPATAAQLDYPTALAVDGAGDLFIADRISNVVREVNSSTGVITTVAGNGTAGYSGDGGQATDAEISNPTGLAVDGFGDLFIADLANNCIREVKPLTGIISTVAGNGTYGYSGDGGQATAAELAYPADVAVDSAGDLFIADYFNNCIREVDAGIQQATTLAFNAVSYSGTYGGTTTLAATLSSSDVDLSGEQVYFTIDGSPVGTAITDANGVATLNNVSLTISAGSHSVGASFDGDVDYSGSIAAAVPLTVNQATPSISWSNPANITYGTALGATQLDATASVAGTFAYTPVSGTVLSAGNAQQLSVLFTPNDALDYTTATKTVSINVAQATPTITWSNPAGITYGTALGITQLDATASVDGTFAYTPVSGTVLSAGNAQQLSVLFTPTDTLDYTTATKTVSINVAQATPTITWTNPAGITYGTALGATQLDATASVPGTFAYTPVSGTVLSAGNAQQLSVLFTPNDAIDYTTATKTVSINVAQATPTITWAYPANITYGTALGATQLDATASVDGTYVYTPPSGTVLSAGNGQQLSVVFTPNDAIDYTTATKSVTINVAQATPTITWSNPVGITYGTALGATQLDATASVDGTYAYTPVSGTVLSAGNAQQLSVVFTPTDTLDYTTATKTVSINVAQATPTITWSNPANITYGTALGATQLDAAANVPGTYTYTPVSGTMLSAGNAQQLSVLFTPNDGLDYNMAAKSVSINVVPATPVITWANPANIPYGTALGATQLDATASVPGTFVYLPASGTALPLGNGQTLSAVFTPTDNVNYATATKNVAINVVPATPTITWANPANIPYGTALGATQLDATASVPGTFVYTPASGAVLPFGNGQTLSAVFTPTDSVHYTTASKSVAINVVQATPTITWANPANIPYGTALGATQLDATASVPGTFVYTPVSGTALPLGNEQTLAVVFTPTDGTDYTTATKSVAINVVPATPVITWPTPANIPYGTALGATQLDATANVPGTFVYSPSSGTNLPVGNGETLSVVFTPTDGTDYTTATKNVSINVVRATPTINWSNPAPISYGTALGATQLDATANVPGTFAYTPASGAILPVGNGQALSVVFTPTDSVDYTTASKSVAINVAVAPTTINWATPAAITYGTALGATQLDATANVSGTFVYTPTSGTVLSAGVRSLSVVFTPTNTADYTTANESVNLTVNPAPLTVTANNQSKVYGATLPALTASYTGFVNGDTQSVLSGSPSLTTTATAASAAGNYAITAAAGTLSAANYSFIGVNGTLTVTLAPLTITADNQSMVTGDTWPPLTATYVGLVNGDTPLSLTHLPTLSTTATSQSPAGIYPINVTGAASNNYTITQVPGTMTVISDVGRAILITDPLNPTKTMLCVSGTAANDVIQINSAATAGYVTVTYDGQSLGSFNPTSRICIHGGGGNDTISVAQSVTLAAWLYADNGNVQLQGGGGPTLLIGGSGKDTLWGGNGRTIMIGGSGAASMVAGSGDAVLIGGTTAYDANAAALMALLNTWSSSASYSIRVSQLMSDPIYPLNASTVYNNNAVDSLFGGSGMDFFFQSPLDNLRNTRSGETVISVDETTETP
jgi:hypothetical protein